MSFRSLLESIHMVCELQSATYNILCEASDQQVAIRSEILTVKENKVPSPYNFRSVHISWHFGFKQDYLLQILCFKS